MEVQNARIMKYLNTHGDISSLEAMRDLGVMRLASRICDLKHQGVRIGKYTEVVTNRFGEKCRITRYFLEGVDR